MMTQATEASPTAVPNDDVSAASAALRTLAAADGGEMLACQLSRLVAVIASEAVRTKRFRTDLLAALVPEPAAAAPAPADRPHSAAANAAPVATRSQLTRMTKPELQQLIDREGMDPDRTIKAKSTKNQMIDLILAFRQMQGAERLSDGESSPESGESSTQGDTAGDVREDVGAAAPDAEDADRTTAAEQPSSALPAAPPKRRRQPSALNPYAVAASDGVQGLREQLQHLDVEQLKDIVAEYGMNHDRRAMSWTDHERFVNRIIEKTDFGATQGSAFRTSR